MASESTPSVVRVSGDDWRLYSVMAAALGASWPEDAGRSRDRRRCDELLRLALAFADETTTCVVSGEDVPWSVMSVHEAADLLHASEVSIRNWCTSGRLRGRKLGPTWAIDPASVLAARRRAAA